MNPGGPEAPRLDGVVLTTAGTSTRKTLVLNGLPAGDAGTIEVFANPTCTGGEAQEVLGLTRTKEADETFRVIQMPPTSPRDHVTVTYTDESGNTSGLSGCRSAQTFGDGDRDGSVDPFDALGDLEDDPTGAIVVTDDEQLIVVATSTEGTTLTGVGPVDDPAPGTHPEGWSLPYGALRFRVEGLEPGGSAQVQIATVRGGSSILGSSYWKYGPPTPGTAPRWYLFDMDEASGTGAVIGAAPTGDGGFAPAFVLSLRDGARGDSDGGANGTITDPGGPVIGGDTDPTDPVDPTPPTEPTPPTGPTTPAAPGGPTALSAPGGAADPTSATGGGTDTGSGTQQATRLSDPATSADGALPRTGTDLGGLLQVAILLVAGGAFLYLVARRRRSSAPT